MEDYEAGYDSQLGVPLALLPSLCHIPSQTPIDYALYARRAEEEPYKVSSGCEASSFAMHGCDEL